MIAISHVLFSFVFVSRSLFSPSPRVCLPHSFSVPSYSATMPVASLSLLRTSALSSTTMSNHIGNHRRRKPENLTPPLSSDGGSSTSGQSPTSTHNGSPPPAVKRPPLNSDKYASSNDGPASKKQRISHYRKDIVNHQDTNISARSKYHDL